MGIWSSILEFYRRWKPQIDLYGVGFLLFASALATERHKAAALILVLVLITAAVRRWGEPYREIGKEEMELKRRASKAYWDDRFGHWFGRYYQEPPAPSPPVTTAPATYLIPRPGRDGEDPPESPGSPMLPDKAPIIIPPPVTHET